MNSISIRDQFTTKSFNPVAHRGQLKKLWLTAALLALCIIILGGCTSTKELYCQLIDESNPPPINFAELTETAVLAGNAYKSSDRITEIYSPNYAVKIYQLPKSSGQVILLKDAAKKRQVVSIRGTVADSIKSILTDAQYSKTKDEKLGIYVHNGFHKAVVELYGILQPKLNKNFSTKITGHSLGGALAVLLTYYLTVDQFNLEQTVTFGQPKVTNQFGVSKFRDANILRVVNDKDPVAAVPPLTVVGALNEPYRHGHPAIELKQSPDYQFICSKVAQISFATEFWSDIIGQDQGAIASFMENVGDHRDKQYIEKLQAIAGIKREPPVPDETAPAMVPDNPATAQPSNPSGAPVEPANPPAPPAKSPVAGTDTTISAPVDSSVIKNRNKPSWDH